MMISLKGPGMKQIKAIKELVREKFMSPHQRRQLQVKQKKLNRLSKLTKAKQGPNAIAKQSKSLRARMQKKAKLSKKMKKSPSTVGIQSQPDKKPKNPVKKVNSRMANLSAKKAM
jgi:hypothetical protein